MMTFQEWIATQDQSKFNLDEASVNSIKDYFMFREIVDDVKMPVFFWRTLNMYREKYKALVRVESIEFDPLVNRYFESEFKTKDHNLTSKDTTKENTVRSTNSQATNMGTIIDERNTEDKEYFGTEKTSDKLAKFGIETSTDEFDNFRDTETFANYNEREEFDNYRETMHGKEKTSEIGSKTTSEELSNTTREHFEDRLTNRTATKAAPMSAVNAGGTTASEGSGNPGGRLGNLDFTYASSYAQADNDGFQDRVTEVSTGTADNPNGKNVTTETYNGRGSEKDFEDRYNEKSGARTLSKNGERIVDKDGKKITTVEFSGSGDHETREDIRDVEKTFDERKDTTSSTLNGRHTTTGSVTDTLSSTNSGSGRDVIEDNNEGVRRNRYTGRENLTPQEAMAQASDYIMGYSPAFQWLVDKLEPCFMAIYDL